MKNDEYFTPQEVADKFKVKKRTVYLWVKEGKLKAVKFGRLLRIPREALEEFVRESSQE